MRKIYLLSLLVIGLTFGSLVKAETTVYGFMNGNFYDANQSLKYACLGDGNCWDYSASKLTTLSAILGLVSGVPSTVTVITPDTTNVPANPAPTPTPFPTPTPTPTPTPVPTPQPTPSPSPTPSLIPSLSVSGNGLSRYLIASHDTLLGTLNLELSNLATATLTSINVQVGGSAVYSPDSSPTITYHIIQANADGSPIKEVGSFTVTGIGTATIPLNILINQWPDRGYLQIRADTTNFFIGNPQGSDKTWVLNVTGGAWTDGVNTYQVKGDGINAKF